jgi:uncharacterized protein (DUF1684 family)
MEKPPMSYVDLLDYRRRVNALYAGVRDSKEDPMLRWEAFVKGRDDLFRTHSQSAISEEIKPEFKGIKYYRYNPSLRFVLPVAPDEGDKIIEVEVAGDGLIRMKRFGKIYFSVAGEAVSLSLYWMMGYGGGIFLPFRDGTCGKETYGGGRYLLDTIKGADLGDENGQLVIDFNYAYNPSCAYDPRWECPLAPLENRLSVPIRAGEMNYESAAGH